MVEEVQKNPRKPYNRKTQSSKEQPKQVAEEQKSGLDLEASISKVQVKKEPSFTAKIEKKERKRISVRSKRMQFYSIAMKFTKQPTILYVDSLKAGDLEILKGEYWLEVTEL